MEAISNETGIRAVDVSNGQCSTLLQTEWMTRPEDERFLDLSNLYGHCWDRAERSEEIDVNTSSLEVELLAGKPVFHFGGRCASTTHWSFGQLCRALRVPADYIGRISPHLALQNLREAITESNDMIKIYADQDRIHSVTSPSYGRYHDFKIVSAVQRLQQLSEVKLKVPGVMDWGAGQYDPMVPVSTDTTTLFASDRDVAMFLCDDLDPIDVGKLPNGDPDLMFRGLFVSNGEMGDRSVYVASMYLRAVCANRCIWGLEQFRELRIRHTKNIEDQVRERMIPILDAFKTRSNPDRVIAGVKAAKEAELITTPPWRDEKEAQDQQLKFLVNTMKFSRAKAEKILLHNAPGTDRRQLTTVWDFANQITHFAQTNKYHSDRLDLERRASALLERVSV